MYILPPKPVYSHGIERAAVNFNEIKCKKKLPQKLQVYISIYSHEGKRKRNMSIARESASRTDTFTI